MAARPSNAGERGQGTVEWVGLVLLVSLLAVAGLAAAGTTMPGAALAETIYERIACAVAISDACTIEPELTAAYGPELAALVRSNAPELRYEDGMAALPVDFRSCRDGDCGNGPESGSVTRSATGEPVVAFVHVVDCRYEDPSSARGFDCSGGRAGNVYVQYWLYFGDSTSLRALPGDIGHHEDDWESYQLRIRPGGTDARASSHHSYNYDGGVGSWLSDAGINHRSAWGPVTGSMYVSGGSHAGHVRDDAEPDRWTPAHGLELIPIETLAATQRRTRFSITAPWRKDVYRDPEDQGT